MSEGWVDLGPDFSRSRRPSLETRWVEKWNVSCVTPGRHYRAAIGNHALKGRADGRDQSTWEGERWARAGWLWRTARRGGGSELASVEKSENNLVACGL